MATQITAGKILRRGADGLSPGQLENLLGNPKQVQQILDDIDNRVTIFRQQFNATQAEIVKLEKKEQALADRGAKLAEDKAAVEVERESARSEHESNMGALSRRTREVAKREEDATARDASLDAKEQEHKASQIARETELADREGVVVEQEAAAEAREAEIMERVKSLKDKETNIHTVARIMTEASKQLAQ